jgi:hypothetical protein
LHEAVPALYIHWWSGNHQAELENHLAEQDEFDTVAVEINRKRKSIELSQDELQAAAEDNAKSIWKKNSRGQQKEDFRLEFQSLLATHIKLKRDRLEHVNDILEEKGFSAIGYKSFFSWLDGRTHQPEFLKQQGLKACLESIAEQLKENLPRGKKSDVSTTPDPSDRQNKEHPEPHPREEMLGVNTVSTLDLEEFAGLFNKARDIRANDWRLLHDPESRKAPTRVVKEINNFCEWMVKLGRKEIQVHK